MSGNYYLRIGAIAFAKPIKVKQESKIETCPNKKCPNHKNWTKMKFCQECGSKVKMINIVTNCNVSLAEFILDDSENSITGIKKEFEGLNFAGEKENMLFSDTFSKEIDPSKERFIEMAVDSTAQLMKFGIKHQVQFHRLKDAGFKLTISWGAFSYYN